MHDLIEVIGLTHFLSSSLWSLSGIILILTSSSSTLF